MALDQTAAEDVTGTNTGGTLSFASAPSENDIIQIVWNEADDAIDGTITPPSGFTQFIDLVRDSGSIHTRIIGWWKRAGSSESTDYAFSWDEQFMNRSQLIGATFTGRVTSGSPLDAAPTTDDDGFAGDIVAPSITPSVDDCDVVHWFSERNWGGAFEASAPSGYTKIPPEDSGQDDHLGATLEQTTAEATGTQSVSGGDDGWISASWAFKPATGGGGDPNTRRYRLTTLGVG